MRFILYTAILMLIGGTSSAWACGGGGFGGSKGGFTGGKGGGGFGSFKGAGAQPVIGGNFQPAMAAAVQINMAKQAAVAQANAYHARMMPVRIANATKVREQKLAHREARKVINIAKLQQRRQLEHQQQEFLVKARKWTDDSGNHSLLAVMVDANSWGVRLAKSDGTTVDVPMQRLSGQDRQWVGQHWTPENEEHRLMLAGL